MEGEFQIIRNKIKLTEYLDWYINFYDFKSPLYIQTSKQNTRLSFKQRGSLHVWCAQLAKELNAEGLTQERVVEKISPVARVWTGGQVKESLYKTMLKALKGIESSEEAGGYQPSDVHYELKKFFQKNFPELNFPEWPCTEK